MKGGYQLLTFNGLPLTSGEASNIKGSWDQVNRANGKRIIVTGLDVGEAAYNDFAIYMTAGENIFEGAATVGSATISISVDNGDDVTVTVA